MGNFSISHYTAIRVESGFIEVLYLIDMAEIPTYQEMQDAAIVPQVGDPSLVEYLAKKAELLADGLSLQLNGQPLRLQPVSQNVIFPAGAGGSGKYLRSWSRWTASGFKMAPHSPPIAMTKLKR